MKPLLAVLLLALAIGRSFTIEAVGPASLDTSAGPLARAGLQVELRGHRVPWQIVSPGDRARVEGGVLHLEPALAARPFLDARYGDLLLGGTESGLNLALPETAEVRLNGEPVAIPDLPRGKAAFVRWDHRTGRVGRLEVVDPLASREPSPGPGDLWSVRLLQPGPFKAGQAVEVEMKAPTGGEATFDLAGVAWGLPAPEVARGVYRGRVRVMPGLDARNTYVLGRYRRGDVEYPVRVGPTLSLAPTGPQVNAVGPVETWTEGPVWAELSSAGTLVQASRTRLILDGVDVTAQTRRTVDLMLYWPARLSPGLHRVELEVADLAGNVTRKSWSFQVP